MKQEEVYRKFQEEIKRLCTGTDYDPAIMSIDVYELYIAEQLEKLPLSKGLSGYILKPLKTVVADDEALLQTIKVITLMEASDNIKEFRTLADKQKKKKAATKKEKGYELTDFDKIVKAIASVPKKDLKQHTINKKK